jgi:hypothetical protein
MWLASIIRNGGSDIIAPEMDWRKKFSDAFSQGRKKGEAGLSQGKPAPAVVIGWISHANAQG